MIVKHLPVYSNPNITLHCNQQLDRYVRKSLGFELEDLERNSIASLGRSNSMNPQCDSFQLLEYELMAHTMRKKHFGDRV